MDPAVSMATVGVVLTTCENRLFHQESARSRGVKGWANADGVCVPSGAARQTPKVLHAHTFTLPTSPFAFDTEFDSGLGGHTPWCPVSWMAQTCRSAIKR